MEQIHPLIPTLKEKTVAVLGMGVSNTPLIGLLLQHQVKVTVRDKNPDPTQKELFEKKGAFFVTGEGYLEGITEDVIFRTPGISPNHPSLKKAKEEGKQITSEMQEFFNFCPCPVIAVTGSDGKTTTTTLISQFLEESGKKVFLGGNIGMPLLCSLHDISPEDVAVVELSSFQLMDLRCDPVVSVVTNLSPNHLDYHGDMEEYVTAKTQIFKHQSPSHKVILNLDNAASQTLRPLISSEIQCFSRLTQEENATACLKDDVICLRNKEGCLVEILPLELIRLKGLHNVENFMTAILATSDFCSAEEIQNVTRNFNGVEHRMEFVREKEGVCYYNDSIGTSPTRTIAGLRSFQEPLILIAGGYDKGIPFQELGEEIHRHVKHLVLVGATASAIVSATEEATKSEGSVLQSVTVCQNLEEAIEKAMCLGESGDQVVLSPACAAFDQFKNFAQRGDFYREKVNKL